MRETWGVLMAGRVSRSHLWLRLGDNRMSVLSKSRCGLIEKTSNIYGEMHDTRCARCVKSAEKEPAK